MRTYLYLFLFFVSFVTGCSTWKLEPKTFAPTNAAFSVSNDGCTVPCNILFTNQSVNATSYLWDFGDSQTSAVMSPTHSYTQAGNFTVKLVATGPGSSTTTQQSVTTKSAAPMAAFMASSYTCTAPCSITFTNQSVNATSYLWDFGDSQTSTVTSPVHSYTLAGAFTVKLTAVGPSSNTATQQIVTIQPSGLNFVWEQLPTFPGLGRSDASVFVIGSKAYMVGGYLAAGASSALQEVWQYDATTTSWTQKQNFSKPVSFATAFANTTTGFLTGIANSNNQAIPGEVWMYAPGTDKWTLSTVPSSLMNRTRCSVCILGQKAYIGVGQTVTATGSSTVTSTTSQTGLLEYDMSTLTSTTLATPAQLAGILQPVMFPLNGKTCMIGGGYKLDNNGVLSRSNNYVEFDPASATKFNNQSGGLPTDVVAVVGLGGRYFGFTKRTDTVYEFKNYSWVQSPNATSNIIPPISDGVIGFAIGDAFYVAFGVDATATNVKLRNVWKLTLK